MSLWNPVTESIAARWIDTTAANDLLKSHFCADESSPRGLRLDGLPSSRAIKEGDSTGRSMRGLGSVILFLFLPVLELEPGILLLAFTRPDYGG